MKTNCVQAIASTEVARKPPVGVKMRRLSVNSCRLYPPDGEGKSWWRALKRAPWDNLELVRQRIPRTATGGSAPAGWSGFGAQGRTPVMSAHLRRTGRQCCDAVMLTFAE
jgi:hypothetical protein